MGKQTSIIYKGFGLTTYENTIIVGLPIMMIIYLLHRVLIPGGATWFNQSSGYADAGRYIYNIAVEMNDRGEHMPIFGTCLGFELFAYITSNNGDPRCDCLSDRQALPLKFEPGIFYRIYFLLYIKIK